MSVNARHNTLAGGSTGDYRRLSGWVFWPLWVVASTCGGMVGIALCKVLIGPFFLVGILVSPILIWIPLSLVQGLLLTHYLRGIITPWVVSSVIGGYISVYMAMLVGMGVYYSKMDYSIGTALLGGAGGLVVGFCQTYGLFNRVAGAGWWILISPIGWAVAMFVESAMDWHGIFFALGGRAEIMQGTATITIASAISGVGMSLMLAYSPEGYSVPDQSIPHAISPTISDDGTPLALP